MHDLEQEDLGGGRAASVKGGPLFSAIDRADVSYDKIVELHDRLLAATKAGTVKWEWRGSSRYAYSAPHGVVEVETKGVSIYDDSGVRLRQFHPGNDGLFRAAVAQHEADAVATIDRILAELDAL